MSSLGPRERDGSESNGAPDAKRPRLDEKEGMQDPSKIIIKIKDHDETYTIDRQWAINTSRYIQRAMTGPWANAGTGIIELQESDHATPDTVGLFKQYLEFLEDSLNSEDPEVEDPLNELEDFGSLANFWLFADFLQSRKITKAIMKEFELKAEEFELLDADVFNSWWAVLENQPPFDMLRGMMLALFVASEAFQDKDTRHEMMRELSPAAQEAIVDELMRQHDDVHQEVRDGAKRLEEYVEDDEGVEELTRLRRRVNTKVVASDFYKTYGN